MNRSLVFKNALLIAIFHYSSLAIHFWSIAQATEPLIVFGCFDWLVVPLESKIHLKNPLFRGEFWPYFFSYSN